MTAPTTYLQSIFTAVQTGKSVRLLMAGANSLQARAFAELLARSRRLGSFRQTQSLDASDVELTFFNATIEQVQAVLDALTTGHLADEIAVIEFANAKHEEAAIERNRVDAMPSDEFGRLLETRSKGKLCSLSTRTYGDLVLTTSALLPVSHFKALARLTTYKWKPRSFTTAKTNLDSKTREGLLILADKLARSTKTVTNEDVAARKMKRRGPQKAISGEALEDAVEDLMYDLYGHDSLQTRQWTREAFAKQYRN